MKQYMYEMVLRKVARVGLCGGKVDGQMENNREFSAVHLMTEMVDSRVAHTNK